MTYAEIIAAWNAQADHMNQWDELCEEEKVEWAWKCALEECAKECEARHNNGNRKYTHADECAAAIRAMKDKP